MKKLFVIFFLLFSFFINEYSIGYPIINNSHPRLYISQTRFNYLDSNKTQFPVNTYYNQFVSNYFGWWYNVPDFYLVGSDSTTWNYVFRYFNSSENGYRDDVLYTGLLTAFIYKLNHDPIQLKRTRFIIDRFNACIDTMTYSGYSSDNLETMLRYYGMLGSALHDWCYNDIDTVKRNNLAMTVYKLNRKFMNSFIYTSGGNSFVSSHNALNSVLTLQNILSIYGSPAFNPPQQDTILMWYHTLCDKWDNSFLPVYGYYRSTTGGWNWGAAYSLWSLTDQFTLFDNFLNGTSKNYYMDLLWVQNSINQYYYMVRPDGISIHQGDGETNVAGDNAIYRHAAIFQDQRSRYLAQKFSVQPYLTSTYTYFNILCFKDFTSPAVSQPILPLNWFADRVGLVVSRSSWDSNAVQYWYFNSLSKKASHEHRDNSTFSIFYKKPLLIDAGYYDYYGSSHFYNYYTRTIAHNTVTVFDSTEQFFVNGNLVSNDGGQIWSDALMNYDNIFQTPYQRGRWLVYANDTGFVYSNTDATMSFNPQKVKRYLRKILYLKPNYFIVLDNIILMPSIISSNMREVRWNAHFKNQPDVSGQIINTQVPGHIETFNGKNYISTNSPAYISINTVYPDSTKTKRIGGAGYEYWVNGINYPTSVPADTVVSTAGNWRIEVIPKILSDTVNLLHTLTVKDILIPNEQNAIKISNETTLGCDYINKLFLFNSKGDTGTTILNANAIPGNRVISIYCFDLKRSLLYNIYIDGIYSSQYYSDTTGIIIKQLNLQPGNHNISVTLNATGNSEIGKTIPKSYQLFQNNPNPFNPVTCIRYDLPKNGFVNIVVYDIRGREVQMLVNEKLNAGTYEATFDGSMLNSGVYFYKLVTDGFTETKKMVLIK